MIKKKQTAEEKTVEFRGVRITLPNEFGGFAPLSNPERDV